MLINKGMVITLLFFCFLKNPGFAQPIDYNFDVSSYDIYYEINAGERIFTSVQNIIITNTSATPLDRIHFLLHPDLVIDDIVLQNSQGKSLPINHWTLPGTTKIFQNELQIVEVSTIQALDSEKEYKFHLEYHMQPGAFKDISQIPDNTLDLVMSSQVSYAVGPYTGHNVIFNRNLLAPFRMRIKYPQGNLCCAPGTLSTSDKKSGYNIETYHCNSPNIPTFSCATYEKKVRKIGDITFEFYLYPGQSFVHDMVTIPAQFVQLYTSHFGDIGTETYRFGNIGAPNSQLLRLENKGNTIYLADLLTRYYTAEEGIRDMFNGLIAHELFHNWNIFSVHWVGQLTDWFEEGGANFIGAWAGEQIISQSFGVSGRTHFTSAYAGERGSPGYDANGTLETISKKNAGDSELMLMYYYGALVWEQLRQKLGDGVFFSGLGDFFRKYRLRTATYEDFLQCMQSKTNVQVAEYLSQWMKHNAKIDLLIANVNIQKTSDIYSNEIEISVDSDRDYDLFTSIGYRTALKDDMEVIDVHTTERGNHTITFQSEGEPVFIQIDPDCRVPQINLDNNIWSQEPKK